MIEPIIDEKSHTRALRRIEELWDSAPGSHEEQELDALATLMDAWERTRYPITRGVSQEHWQWINGRLGRGYPA